MEYLLTFEDGSSGYLSHHGVKGMHWGVWNEETSARYAGGKGRAKKKHNLSKGGEFFLKQGIPYSIEAGLAVFGGLALTGASVPTAAIIAGTAAVSGILGFGAMATTLDDDTLSKGSRMRWGARR